MTAVRTRNGSFKIVATMGMVLLMAFFTACDVLATEDARDAIANGREIREFEDENLRPLEEKMNDLWVSEIEPRERELEDLRYDLQVKQDELLSPLWDAQNDPWAPGGEASVLQEKFDDLNREYDLMQRQIDLEQRELDADWQVLWNSNTVDPEYQALEDERFEKQRELDRLYRFGNRPIDDLWDQINELHTSQGFANTDSQIESELINAELRRLWDLQSDLQNGTNDEVNRLYEQAAVAQKELDNLWAFGWNPINDIYAEIDQLQGFGTAGGTVFTSFDAAGNPISTTAGSSSGEISELQEVLAGYILNRDAELEAWNATLEELQAESAQGDTSEETAALEAQIAEYEAVIAENIVKAADLIAGLEADLAEFESAIDERNAQWDQDIADETAEFLASSADLLGQADAIQVEIDELTEADEVANADQIAALQVQKDALIADEEALEEALHDLIEEIDAGRVSGVADLQEVIDDIQAELDGDPTGSIDSEREDYEGQVEELRKLLEESNGGDSNQAEIDAVLDSIAATKEFWNGRIDEITAKIEVLTASEQDDSANEDRINNLRLQAAEMEKDLNNQIEKLQNLINELYDKANNFNSGDSEEAREIQRQIDALNEKLEAIWAEDSANGLEILIKVQALEKQVRVLEEEREDEQYRLEEELWDLDDRLSRFYKDQNSDYQQKETEFQSRSDELQQRRFALDELRWVLNDEQQDAWDEFEVQRQANEQEIKRIESDELGTVQAQIRELENELQVFYDQRRDIEIEIRAAQNLVEQKKRELEDKVFDALESAAGTVDEAGDVVLTATEESVPDIDEGTEFDAAGNPIN